MPRLGLITALMGCGLSGCGLVLDLDPASGGLGSAPDAAARDGGAADASRPDAVADASPDGARDAAADAPRAFDAAQDAAVPVEGGWSDGPGADAAADGGDASDRDAAAVCPPEAECVPGTEENSTTSCPCSGDTQLCKRTCEADCTWSDRVCTGACGAYCESTTGPICPGEEGEFQFGTECRDCECGPDGPTNCSMQTHLCRA